MLHIKPCYNGTRLYVTVWKLNGFDAYDCVYIQWDSEPLFTKRTDVLPQVSWGLGGARFGSRLFQSLWILTGSSTAALPRCLSNCRAIRSLSHPISRLRDLRLTSYRLVDRDPGTLTRVSIYKINHCAVNLPIATAGAIGKRTRTTVCWELFGYGRIPK